MLQEYQPIGYIRPDTLLALREGGSGFIMSGDDIQRTQIPVFLKAGLGTPLEQQLKEAWTRNYMYMGFNLVLCLALIYSVVTR